MEKLDLHKTRHNDVRNDVVRFIESHWDSGEQVDIITGHSSTMKVRVIEVLDEYKLEWKEGDHLGFNKGFIRVQL